MFCPKLSHKKALKTIGHFLKATYDKGIIPKSSPNVLKIDNHLDADFGGMYRCEAMGNPAFVKS